jgi:hypothetical protein
MADIHLPALRFRGREAEGSGYWQGIGGVIMYLFFLAQNIPLFYNNMI